MFSIPRLDCSRDQDRTIGKALSNCLYCLNGSIALSEIFCTVYVPCLPIFCTCALLVVFSVVLCCACELYVTLHLNDCINLVREKRCLVSLFTVSPVCSQNDTKSLLDLTSSLSANKSNKYYDNSNNIIIVP